MITRYRTKLFVVKKNRPQRYLDVDRFSILFITTKRFLCYRQVAHSYRRNRRTFSFCCAECRTTNGTSRTQFTIITTAKCESAFESDYSSSSTNVQTQPARSDGRMKCKTHMPYPLLLWLSVNCGQLPVYKGELFDFIYETNSDKKLDIPIWKVFFERHNDEWVKCWLKWRDEHLLLFYIRFFL